MEPNAIDFGFTRKVTHMLLMQQQKKKNVLHFCVVLNKQNKQKHHHQVFMHRIQTKWNCRAYQVNEYEGENEKNVAVSEMFEIVNESEGEWLFLLSRSLSLSLIYTSLYTRPRSRRCSRCGKLKCQSLRIFSSLPLSNFIIANNVLQTSNAQHRA